MEYQHLLSEGNFLFETAYSLPDDFELDMKNAETKEIVDRHVLSYLSAAYIKPLTNPDDCDQKDLKRKMTLKHSMAAETSKRDISVESKISHKNKLSEYDRSLSKCIEFINSKKVEDFGLNQVDVEIEFFQNLKEAKETTAVDKPQNELFRDVIAIQMLKKNMH